ncbi:aldehyde dehydrogenase [Robertmurraya kyonggiensis]|uniref:Aldehyde dehydrogenase n=1 Tax=Robertmurraya kyonggiensis TaxID=1037680 RepID=A0A4U1DCX2_9BACI|nr:aldehyde dehydrogenase [Robertmurraya kyonggiensis]TKC19296.1 aldehyde dehydrogenase [Robertmurraya kyonggiensis]
MESYGLLVEKQRDFFHTDQTKEISFRIQALETLRKAIKNGEQELIESLKQDLNKSEFDAYSTEIGIVLEEIRFTLKHLSKWAKPRRVKTPVTHIGSKSYIFPEPYGVTLIIAPWNYPFQLAIAPLIGAIAAGNCAVLKPSELTPKTSNLMAKLLKENFPEEFITVIEGGVETSEALLKEKFDYIFFTGSVPVGKIIMEAASKHLTPVTLELGGKSPCIVHEDANIRIAAKRIAWGKFMNAGQTCIAPDYLFVHQNIKDEFLSQLKATVAELYGDSPLENENFTKIVSERHFNRLQSFLNNGTVFVGGGSLPEQLKIEPTVLTDISWDDAVMEDEIFGPILPVLEYNNMGEIIDEINKHPKPLALYLFTESELVQSSVLNRVSFGGGCINDTVYHITSPYLPFGGVGSSGTGAYHGKGSFDTFSHEKSVLKQTTLFDIPLRYPNFKDGLKYIKLFFK